MTSRPVKVDPKVYKRDGITPMLAARIAVKVEQDPLRDNYEGKAKKTHNTECIVDYVRYIVYLQNLDDCDMIIRIAKAQSQH